MEMFAICAGKTGVWEKLHNIQLFGYEIGYGFLFLRSIAFYGKQEDRLKIVNELVLFAKSSFENKYEAYRKQNKSGLFLLYIYMYQRYCWTSCASRVYAI